MINTYQTSMPPPPIPPRLGSVMSAPGPGHSKPLIRFLIGMIVLQMVLLLGGFTYLYHTDNKYHKDLDSKYLDDMIILKRLEECEKDIQSVLDCKNLVEKYKSILAKVSQEEGRAAKLTGDGPSYGAMARMIVKQPVSGTPPTKYLEWNIGHSVRKNVQYYMSSWLKVLQPGDYNIYSQVAFSKWHPKTPLASRVKLRKGETGEEKDLMTAYCSLGDQDHTDVCTAFQGGVFRLEPDDQLSVWVTDPSLVNYEEGTTTFGLYKL
ncbi:CD40 ligand-like isoform X1 [Oncorhynchus nerka]|uniref:CD40 ligand-like isoform X1 n=1 Tax=Oncorhynchus nerka TaxID=8023 RepID=UPI00113148D7|nr:CD40 ligand-like isoform X1 [Oncorhynchus nerka]